MRKFFLLALAAMCAMEVLALAPELTYNGTVLPWNTEFTRTQCGTLKKDVIIPEISGIACSRVTPGYIWMQSDDYSDCIVATTEEGQTRNMLVNFTSVIRNDWEDMCGGVYNGKNYLFIGAIGDNNTNKGNYYIVYFEEPAITSGSKSITPSYIKFQYSDGKNHNAESLMYDPKEEMLYIVTKVYYNVNQVFKMPFRLDYGETVQTFQYVCDLGIKSDMGPGENPSKGFHLATAADISPDGKYVLIKNHNNTDTCSQYSWILLWERQGEESISETIKRQPQPLACYEHEWQGEAICWLDDNTFYTTSDDDGNPPVYK